MTPQLTEKIPEWKRDEIEEFERLIDEYDAVGVVDVEGIASKQFQELRSNLHGTAVVRVGRNTLMRRALEEKGLESLLDYVEGQTGLLLTNDNPFTLYRKIEEGKSSAPISAGQEATDKVVVPEGDTGFDPGPMVGDLQQAGISARIEEGSIKVVEDSVVLEPGEVATPEIEEALAKLGIEPLEVGLKLRALVEKDEGTVLEPETLDIDIDEYRADLEAAAGGAFNLGVNAGVVNDTTRGPLLSKAYRDALAVGIEAGVYEPEVLDSLLAEADADVRALATHLDDDALPEELQGVEAEAEPEPEATEADEEEEEEETDEQEAEEADEDEGDTDEDVSEGMGNLF
ncbi:MAG: 50S ribosomal protein L10 [Halobacteriales archaeon]|nr:50S ribosomal protein L10 [Halobacteriales archaeon]